MSYYKAIYHLVFATKGRHRTIDPRMEDQAFAVIAKYAQEEGAFTIKVGGMADHVHILTEIPVTIYIPDFLKVLKQRTSNAFKAFLPNWAGWQKGYGLFTVSTSQVPVIENYIIKQKEHHMGFSSLEEFKGFLKKNGIAYNPDFLGRE